MSSDPAGKTSDIPPLPDASWPTELADMLPGFAGRLNVYRTMAHHPALLRAWGNLRDHIVNGSALGLDYLEVVILRSGIHLKSHYEWSHHVDRARKQGFSDTRIHAMRGPVAVMEDADGLLCQAVDDLFENARIAPDTLAALIDRFGKHAVFDLMATVGFYSTLGFILNTFETPLDEDIHARLSANPLCP